MKIFDSHCHLIAAQINSSIVSEPLLIPAIYLDDSIKLIKYKLNSPQIKIGCGLHPWYIQDTIADKLNDQLKLICKNNQIDFIGETGLDKLKNSFIKQMAIFEIHLKLAKEFDLPVIIHCVQAYNEVLTLVKKYQINKGIIHAFNQNYYIAGQFINQGFKLGLGSLTLNPNNRINKIVKNTPIEAIVIESDAPYMKSIYTGYSLSSDCFFYAQYIAKIKNINLLDFIKQVNRNLIDVFN